jgi:hypothetical protein
MTEAPRFDLDSFFCRNPSIQENGVRLNTESLCGDYFHFGQEITMTLHFQPQGSRSLTRSERCQTAPGTLHSGSMRRAATETVC